MKPFLVLDIEVAVSPTTLPRGWDETCALGVGLACTYDSRDDRYHVYAGGQIDAIRRAVLSAISSSVDIVTFNGYRHDIPVLFGIGQTQVSEMFPGNAVESFDRGDILRSIWKSKGLDPSTFAKATHGGWGLDSVGRGTLGRGKTGKSLDASTQLAAGAWGVVADYCLNDVALTRDIWLVASSGRPITSEDRGESAIIGPLAMTAEALAMEAPRSPHWPSVRKAHLQAHPTCASCGTRDSLQVHHIMPFHLDPTLELNPTNFITLCEGAVRNCHYREGHFYDWKLFNPNVVYDAEYYLSAYEKARAKA